MSKTTPAQNKALVLEAFETLFNRRRYAGPSGSAPTATSSAVAAAHRKRAGAGRLINVDLVDSYSGSRGTLNVRPDTAAIAQARL
jgi:hypothetical protein